MLPKIEWPLFEFEIPSLSRKVKFRQILVKEEKILTIAKQSGETSDILLAVRQIVNNCCQDPATDVDKLALFDLEWLFIKLFAVSFTNVIQPSYQDNDDQQIRTFDVNLDEVKMPSIKGIDNNIKIDGKYGIVFNFPAVSLYSDPKFMDKNLPMEELINHVAIKCVKNVYGEQQAFEFTEPELAEWFDNLDVKTLDKVRQFFASIPQMSHTIEYTNAAGDQRKIVLSTLNDFFSWF